MIVMMTVAVSGCSDGDDDDDGDSAGIIIKNSNSIINNNDDDDGISNKNNNKSCQVREINLFVKTQSIHDWFSLGWISEIKMFCVEHE